METKEISSAKILSLAKEFIQKGKLMQVATTNNNQPWVISCWYTFDDNLNFYFISKIHNFTYCFLRLLL